MFPAYFVVLDCEIDIHMPVILRRPFLSTRKALVDVEGGQLKLRVNDEVVGFNTHKYMMYWSDMHVVSHLEQIDEVVSCIGEAVSWGFISSSIT